MYALWVKAMGQHAGMTASTVSAKCCDASHRGHDPKHLRRCRAVMLLFAAIHSGKRDRHTRQSTALRNIDAADLPAQLKVWDTAVYSHSRNLHRLELCR